MTCCYTAEPCLFPSKQSSSSIHQLGLCTPFFHSFLLPGPRSGICQTLLVTCLAWPGTGTSTCTGTSDPNSSAALPKQQLSRTAAACLTWTTFLMTMASHSSSSSNNSHHDWSRSLQTARSSRMATGEAWRTWKTTWGKSSSRMKQTCLGHRADLTARQQQSQHQTNPRGNPSQCPRPCSNGGLGVWQHVCTGGAVEGNPATARRNKSAEA